MLLLTLLALTCTPSRSLTPTGPAAQPPNAAQIIQDKRRAAQHRLLLKKQQQGLHPQQSASLGSVRMQHTTPVAPCKSALNTSIDKPDMAGSPRRVAIKRKREEAMALRRQKDEAKRTSQPQQAAVPATPQPQQQQPVRMPECSAGTLQLGPCGAVPKQCNNTPVGPVIAVDLKLVSRNPDMIAATFKGYSECLIGSLRRVTGSTYHAQSRTWHFPLASRDQVVQSMSRCPGVRVRVSSIPDRLAKGLIRRSAPVEEGTADHSALEAMQASDLWPKLMGFQRTGVEFGLRCHGRLLVPLSRVWCR